MVGAGWHTTLQEAIWDRVWTETVECPRSTSHKTYKACSIGEGGPADTERSTGTEARTGVCLGNATAGADAVPPPPVEVEGNEEVKEKSTWVQRLQRHLGL